LIAPEIAPSSSPKPPLLLLRVGEVSRAVSPGRSHARARSQQQRQQHAWRPLRHAQQSSRSALFPALAPPPPQITPGRGAAVPAPHHDRSYASDEERLRVVPAPAVALAHAFALLYLRHTHTIDQPTRTKNKHSFGHHLNYRGSHMRVGKRGVTPTASGCARTGCSLRSHKCPEMRFGGFLGAAFTHTQSRSGSSAGEM
jgi:hypothetical protein